MIDPLRVAETAEVVTFRQASTPSGLFFDSGGGRRDGVEAAFQALLRAVVTWPAGYGITQGALAAHARVDRERLSKDAGRGRAAVIGPAMAMNVGSSQSSGSKLDARVVVSASGRPGKDMRKDPAQEPRGVHFRTGRGRHERLLGLARMRESATSVSVCIETLAPSLAGTIDDPAFVREEEHGAFVSHGLPVMPADTIVQQLELIDEAVVAAEKLLGGSHASHSALQALRLARAHRSLPLIVSVVGYGFLLAVRSKKPPPAAFWYPGTDLGFIESVAGRGTPWATEAFTLGGQEPEALESLRHADGGPQGMYLTRKIDQGEFVEPTAIPGVALVRDLVLDEGDRKREVALLVVTGARRSGWIIPHDLEDEAIERIGTVLIELERVDGLRETAVDELEASFNIFGLQTSSDVARQALRILIIAGATARTIAEAGGQLPAWL